VFRFLLGICDTGAYIKSGPIIFIIWSFLVTIWYFYLSLPVIIAILINSFDEVTKEQGHVSDHKQTNLDEVLQSWPREKPMNVIKEEHKKLQKRATD
jgi:hypothetical protein